MTMPRSPFDVRVDARVMGYRGHQVMEYVRASIAECGYAPSYSMICARLGIGERTEVRRIVERLEKRGLLKRVGDGRAHRIQLAA